jgi:thiamine pyrophosphokinase
MVFQAEEGTRVSIMPMGEATVSVTGLRWAFSKMRMTPDGFASPSNAAAGGAVTIETDGPILVTLPRAHLAIAMKAVVRDGSHIAPHPQ